MKFSGTAAATAALFASTAHGIFNAKNDIALYWGQNSYGQDQGQPLAQQNLSTYCANSNVNVIQMSFVTKMTTGQGGQPVVNFANGGYSCTTFDGTALWNCPTYEEDLRVCQQTYGKTILLSIGGAMYSEGGFTSQAQAVSWADKMWNTFGPVNPSSGALRPFHNGVIDGFDFDIESKNSYFRAFALRLRTLMNANTSKQWYLTASPQCPYPDFMDPMFNDPNGGVPFDAVFVQYYNNYPRCSLQQFSTSGSQNQNSGFNFQTWHNWATQRSANKAVKVFLGVVGGPTGSGNSADYKNPAGLRSIINYCKTFSSFGGVSVWDASQAYATVKAGTPFLQNVKQNLNTAAKRVVRLKRSAEIVEEEA